MLSLVSYLTKYVNAKSSSFKHELFHITSIQGQQQWGPEQLSEIGEVEFISWPLEQGGGYGGSQGGGYGGQGYNNY